MTSEEIKAAKQQLIDNPDIDVRVAQGAALYEIAYQIAKMNENPQQCICGHARTMHGVSGCALACSCTRFQPLA